MVDYTQRTALDALTYTARSLDTTSFSQRATLDTNFYTTGTETCTDTTAPTISNIYAIQIGVNNIRLGWDTDEDANCTVLYGVATQTATLSLLSVGPTHHHYIKTGRNYLIEDLPANTVIYFYVGSEDRYGNGRSSSYYSFKTADTNAIGIAPTVVA